MFRRHDAHTDCKPLVFSIIERRRRACRAMHSRRSRQSSPHVQSTIHALSLGQSHVSCFHSPYRRQTQFRWVPTCSLSPRPAKRGSHQLYTSCQVPCRTLQLVPKSSKWSCNRQTSTIRRSKSYSRTRLLTFYLRVMVKSTKRASRGGASTA
jgi:hypothetical protein